MVITYKNLLYYIKIYFLFVVITLSFGVGSAKVFASDQTFYSLNDILFYDPDSCAVGSSEGTGVLVGNDNLEKILRYYVGKGLTLAQASGIAGNYGRESSFNPAVIQGGAIAPDNYIPVDSVGFGIAQWTFTSRQAPLVALSQSTNRKITDLSLQLDYSWQELNGSHARALVTLKQAVTPDNAAYVFHRDYEGSADTEAEVKTNRGGDAISIYNQFKSVIPDGSSSVTASTVCTGNGEASEYIDGFVVYNQNDTKWSGNPYGNGATIGSSGCGPAAMAMIITALTKQTVTPADTAAYGASANPSTVYYDQSGAAAGSRHNIHSVMGDNWGLKSTYLGKDVAKINQGLRSGGLVVTAGSGASPFTTTGHIIVIRAVTAEGKWLIGDSNSTIGEENSKKEWDPAYILSMVGDSKYVWLLTK